MNDSNHPRRSVSTAVLAVALGVTFLFALALPACSTTEGFGKDVKNLGGSIEDSAAENK